jgi:hypothetical protein
LESTQRERERREEKLLRKIQDVQQELDSNGGHGKARRGRRFYSGGGAVHRREVWTADETHQDVVAGGSSGESQIISAQIECPCSSNSNSSSYATDTKLQQLHHQVCPAATQLEAARLSNGKESPDMVCTRNTHINSSIDLHCNNLWKKTTDHA